MFRGPDVWLPFDNPGRGDPRPQPPKKYSPEQAVALCKSQGYGAFEMFDWRDPAEADGYAKAQRKYGLECACIVANKGVFAEGCSLVDPAEHEGFLREIEASIKAARNYGCTKLVVLSGIDRDSMTHDEQVDNCVKALRMAAPILEKAGMTAIVEPVNSKVSRPGYFLATAGLTFEVIERVGSPNVKCLFDIYHVQIMEGNLIPTIRDKIDMIGHFHIGDHPGRHGPGTGEINYPNVLRAIAETGFEGWNAIEYHPLIELPEAMAAVKKLANHG